MLELVATGIITASSVFLFAYWFRYTCLLILSAKTTLDSSKCNPSCPRTFRNSIV
jgi:hypothetical protein